MELRQLHYFVTLAEELHFRRAAERVHIAQPAFSGQIRRLESELRTRLFDRTSHYVRLTEAGRLFLDEVRPALAQVEYAATVAARAGQGVLGTLSVGLAGAAVNALTPVILREFATRCPDVAVELREYGFADPSAGLTDGAADAALLRLPVPGQQELDVVPLSYEERVAVMCADHPLAGSLILTAEQVALEPFVIGPRAFMLRGPRPLEPTADTVEEWLSLIAAGRGIGLAPASIAQFHAHPGVQFVAIAGIADSTLAIAYRRDGATPAVREFVDAAVTVARRADMARGRAPGDRDALSPETDFALAGSQAVGHG